MIQYKMNRFGALQVHVATDRGLLVLDVVDTQLMRINYDQSEVTDSWAELAPVVLEASRWRRRNMPEGCDT